MTELRITGGVVLIDSDDLDWAARHTWSVKRDRHTHYAWRNGGDGRKVLMHREVLERHGHDLTGRVVHHRNHNGLDNHRANLEATTRTVNNQDRRKQRNNRSGVTGVSWDAWSGKWRASVCAGGRVRHLGRFDSIEQAAAALREVL